MQKGKLTMNYVKLTRNVFLVLALLFAGAASSQELVAVAKPTEPTSTAPKPESSPKPARATSSQGGDDKESHNHGDVQRKHGDDVHEMMLVGEKSREADEDKPDIRRAPQEATRMARVVLSQNRSEVPKNRPSRNAVSALIARLPRTISLIRRGGTLSPCASLYWESPSGLRKSSSRTSPG